MRPDCYNALQTTWARWNRHAMSQRTMAFDVEPSERRYRLRLARYKGLAEAVSQYAGERGACCDPEGDSPIFAPVSRALEGDSPIFAARKLGQSPGRQDRLPSPLAPLPQAGE